jgi:hypothetical protein
LLQADDIREFLQLRKFSDLEVSVLARAILAGADRRPLTPLEVAKFTANYERQMMLTS